MASKTFASLFGLGDDVFSNHDRPYVDTLAEFAAVTAAPGHKAEVLGYPDAFPTLCASSLMRTLPPFSSVLLLLSTAATLLAPPIAEWSCSWEIRKKVLFRLLFPMMLLVACLMPKLLMLPLTPMLTMRPTPPSELVLTTFLPCSPSSS